MRVHQLQFVPPASHARMACRPPSNGHTCAHHMLALCFVKDRRRPFIDGATMMHDVHTILGAGIFALPQYAVLFADDYACVAA
jgi:hypothetical protein